MAMTIHPNRSVQFDFNRAPQEGQDFFCRLVQSINPSGPPQYQAEPPPVNIHKDKFFHLPTAEPHQHPEVAAQLFPTMHPEKVENNALMVNIWIQDPYCWLQCDQLVEACQGTNNIKDFWFKLWDALDKWKTEANSRTRRIFAAHELSAPRPPPQTPVDSHLQDQMFQKIQKMTANIRREDLRPWQTAINTLTVMLSQWPNWKKTIDMILAHHFTNRQKEEKYILICYYTWTDDPVLVNSEGQEIRSKNYCWGHATDPSSALQIALAGGIRPASTIDENNALYHWCPSCYCRIDGSLTHASITKDLYIQQSVNTIIHTRKYSQLGHRPYIFHGIGKSRQQHHYKVVQGGVGGEYTASLFFDIVHGHDRRWLVRSHLAATMSFSV